MTRLKVAGLCIVAAFVLGATAAASYAAEEGPEYFICAKTKGTGKYEDKACSKPASPGPGNYERVVWTHAKKKLVKAKNKGRVLENLVNPFGENMKAGEPGQIEGQTTCGKEQLAGEVSGPRSTIYKTTYSKCSTVGVKCNSAGQPEGTIVTDQLESELVWLDKARTKVGIRIKGLGPGGRLEQFQCVNPALHVNVHVNVYGEILAEIQGDNGIASKTAQATAGEGPLHLQSVGGTYVEEPFGSPENDEQEAKGWWEYNETLLACRNGKPPFPPGENSQATCELLLGGPNPVPLKPVLLETVVTGGEEIDAPGIQNEVGIIKGEAFGVGDGPFAP